MECLAQRWSTTIVYFTSWCSQDLIAIDFLYVLADSSWWWIFTLADRFSLHAFGKLLHSDSPTDTPHEGDWSMSFDKINRILRGKWSALSSWETLWEASTTSRNLCEIIWKPRNSSKRALSFITRQKAEIFFKL